MVEQLKQYIAENGLVDSGETTLIAASAGIDSTVLCHLFKQAGFPFAIAHCNFELRGNESDGDALFVEQLAQSFSVPFFCKNFQTEHFSKQSGISIQMAARGLRYSWLNELVEKNGFAKIATAHHQDDNIETVILNFTKGCGIRGVRGILPINNKIIRPLLFASKNEIKTYSEENKIKYREDKSNASDKYQRNKIRHHVMPILEEINPNLNKNASDSIKRLQDVELIFNQAIQKFRSELLEEDKSNNNWKIDWSKLLSTVAPQTVLFELISTFGFNGDQAAQIVQAIGNEPGRLFYSQNYRLLVDRKYLIIDKGEQEEFELSITLPKNDLVVEIPNGNIKITFPKSTPAEFSNDASVAIFDADKLQGPFKLRRWNSGDWFQPIGMEGKRKKIQDFFTNAKLSRIEKEQVWILESAGEICWVVGYRMDERFKITPNTERCISIQFNPHYIRFDKNEGS